MLEALIDVIKTVPWYWVLLIAFFLTFIENLFPPSPSDTLLLFIGTLVPLGIVDFVPLLIVSTLGSAIGFWVMFNLGRRFGVKIVDSNRFKFINQETLKAPEEWFRKWGYLVIVINRFISGTRAVIAFFAGMSKLNRNKTLIYCSISALAWNALIIYLGVIFGENWELADYYMSLYGWILIPLIAAIIIFFIIRALLKKSAEKRKAAEQSNN